MALPSVAGKTATRQPSFSVPSKNSLKGGSGNMSSSHNYSVSRGAKLMFAILLISGCGDTRNSVDSSRVRVATVRLAEIAERVSEVRGFNRQLLDEKRRI